MLQLVTRCNQLYRSVSFGVTGHRSMWVMRFSQPATKNMPSRTGDVPKCQKIHDITRELLYYLMVCSHASKRDPRMDYDIYQQSISFYWNVSFFLLSKRGEIVQIVIAKGMGLITTQFGWCSSRRRRLQVYLFLFYPTKEDKVEDLSFLFDWSTSWLELLVPSAI
jgi:hypothetical protein